jgi:hypothetical protein
MFIHITGDHMGREKQFIASMKVSNDCNKVTYVIVSTVAEDKYPAQKIPGLL